MIKYSHVDQGSLSTNHELALQTHHQNARRLDCWAAVSSSGQFVGRKRTPINTNTEIQPRSSLKCYIKYVTIYAWVGTDSKDGCVLPGAYEWRSCSLSLKNAITAVTLHVHVIVEDTYM